MEIPKAKKAGNFSVRRNSLKTSFCDYEREKILLSLLYGQMNTTCMYLLTTHFIKRVKWYICSAFRWTCEGCVHFVLSEPGRTMVSLRGYDMKV